MMSEDIIERAPDKMMQIVDGYLVLAWQNDIIIVNFEKEGILKDEPNQFDNFK